LSTITSAVVVLEGRLAITDGPVIEPFEVVVPTGGMAASAETDAVVAGSTYWLTSGAACETEPGPSLLMWMTRTISWKRTRRAGVGVLLGAVAAAVAPFDFLAFVVAPA